MKTKVKIDGVRQELDLTRVMSIIDLHTGSKVLVIHPETKRLCKAMVMSIDVSGITVMELARVIAPYRWTISKKRVYHKVYKINK